MDGINPKLFGWARETIGLDIANAARGLKIVEGKLEAIEAGDDEPTFTLLKKMADLYRRPITTFYLSAPPQPSERGQDFRTTTAEASEVDEVRVQVLTRDVMARHAIIKSALEDDEDHQRVKGVGSADIKDGVEKVVANICSELKISTAVYRSCKNADAGFSYLRQACERHGIFVLLLGNLGSYHSNISVDAFRGFVVADVEAPLIVINDQDAKAAWSFTLLHEVAHLWIGVSGISAGFSENKVEQFCNNVAGVFLLPQSDISAVNLGGDDADVAETISRLAKDARVSRQMVAYRLFLYGSLDKERWTRLDGKFREMWIAEKAVIKAEARKSEGGPSFHIVKRHRLGDALTNFVSRSLDSGVLTHVKAARVLGVNPRTVQSLLAGN